jgi:hypothetical protein
LIRADIHSQKLNSSDRLRRPFQHPLDTACGDKTAKRNRRNPSECFNGWWHCTKCSQISDRAILYLGVDDLLAEAETVDYGLIFSGQNIVRKEMAAFESTWPKRMVLSQPDDMDVCCPAVFDLAGHCLDQKSFVLDNVHRFVAFEEYCRGSPKGKRIQTAYVITGIPSDPIRSTKSLRTS